MMKAVPGLKNTGGLLEETQVVINSETREPSEIYYGQKYTAHMAPWVPNSAGLFIEFRPDGDGPSYIVPLTGLR